MSDKYIFHSARSRVCVAHVQASCRPGWAGRPVRRQRLMQSSLWRSIRVAGAMMIACVVGYFTHVACVIYTAHTHTHKKRVLFCRVLRSKDNIEIMHFPGVRF